VPSAGRDSRGRFTKGNPGGPGNPFARRIAAFRTALCTVVTEKDIQELAYQLLAQAKLGDLASAKLLLAYAIGRPTDAVDPDALDVKELQLFRQGALEADDFDRTPADIGVPVVRLSGLVKGQALAGKIANHLKDPGSRSEESESARQD
jgi:hypothetical protein